MVADRSAIDVVGNVKETEPKEWRSARDLFFARLEAMRPRPAVDVRFDFGHWGRLLRWSNQKPAWASFITGE
jgi:hypothetical protein